MTKQIKDSFVFNEKLLPHLTKDIVIKDEDVKAKYDELLKEQKDAFTTDIDKITDEDKEKEKTLKEEALQAAMEAYQNLIASYESSLANGTDITAVVVYNPDEVRYIKNILVKFSDTNIDNLQTLMSNVMYAEDEEAKAEAQKIYDDALAIAAKTVESKVNNILSKINAKEDFDKIMAELGEDDGMKADPYKTRGYSVTKEGTSFIQEFVDESFKLAKVGDVSKPFSTYYGTHIVKFAATVSKGDVPFENAKGDIKKLLESEKSNELLQNKIEEWEKAANIEKFEDIYLA